LAAAILGFAYFFGRILYSIGYCKSPNNRIVGAIILDISFIGAFILSLVTIGMWGKA
jgi:hypothetical protein